MLDIRHLSRPLQRLLAEWVGKLADRLLRFKSQLRYSFIELISSSVAETIEDNLHRPFEKSSPPQELEDESWNPNYLTSDGMHYPYPERPIRRIETGAGPTHQLKKQGWLAMLAMSMKSLWRWLQGSWAEPIIVSAIALISFLLFIR